MNFKSSKIDGVSCNVASIVLADRYVFLGGGYAEKSDRLLEMLQPGVDVGPVFEIPRRHPSGKAALPTIEMCLITAVEKMAQEMPNVEAVAVSSFGPFDKIGIDNRGSSGYGTMLANPGLGRASDFNLYDAMLAALDEQQSRKIKEKIRIAVDVNAAALGEHYTNAEEARLSASERRSCTAYVKISNTINVGFTFDGWMSRGSHHPALGSFEPRLYRDQAGVDTFRGICNLHDRCIFGLSSVAAIEKRAGLSFEEIPDAHEVWHFSAFYIAQLITNISLTLSPRRIALGGRAFRKPSTPTDSPRNFRVRDELVELVRAYFMESLLGVTGEALIPNYPKPNDIDDYIQYRTCPHPGIAGGLLLARRDLFPPTAKSKVIPLIR